MKPQINKIKKSSCIIMSLILLTGFISLLIWIINFPGIRRVYSFTSHDGLKTYTETRYAPVKPVQGKYTYYVDELLLGPIEDLGAPIFAKGTKVISCFERENILYVNLSKELLSDNAFTTDYRKKIQQFESNIKHNFSTIKQVVLFIDGKVPFEQ